MSIKIGDYMFEGPHKTTQNIENRSGVYAILCPLPNGKYEVIDIGEAKEVKDRLDDHDRKGCWNRQCPNGYMYAIHYTPHAQKTGRMEVEQKLRKLYDPPCGER